MNEEIKKEELEIMEEVVDDYNEVETSGSKMLATVVIGAVCAGVAAILYKNRGKIEEWRIKRLEKKGYIVYKPDEVDDEDFEEVKSK